MQQVGQKQRRVPLTLRMEEPGIPRAFMYLTPESVHEEGKEDNDECFTVLFTGKSLIQWSGLKTLYICNTSPTYTIAKLSARRHGTS